MKNNNIGVFFFRFNFKFNSAQLIKCSEKFYTILGNNLKGDKNDLKTKKIAKKN